MGDPTDPGKPQMPDPGVFAEEVSLYARPISDRGPDRGRDRGRTDGSSVNRRDDIIASQNGLPRIDSVRECLRSFATGESSFLNKGYQSSSVEQAGSCTDRSRTCHIAEFLNHGINTTVS